LEFLEDDEFRDLCKEDLLPRVPAGYRLFLFVADREAVSNPEFPSSSSICTTSAGAVFAQSCPRFRA
jgi:hypothetical protein